MSLTPPAIVALVFAALLGIAGEWSGALGAFPWWRLAVALLVIGVIAEFLLVRRRPLSARWHGADRLFLGRSETLELELDNPSAPSLTAQFAPVLPDALAPADQRTRTVAIPAGESRRARVAVRPVMLGSHPWPRLPVRVLGRLGLAWWPRRLDPPSELTVLPDTLGRRAAVTGSAEAGSTAQSKLGGARELHHLRGYQAGDPRHTIDWKASARASRLITRVFSEDQHLEIVVMLDAGRTSRTEIDGMSQFGHYVNLAARFAEYCVAGDDRVGLVAFADRPLCVVAPGRGLAAVTRIRRALAALEPRAVESDTLEAALRVRRLVRHRCLAVVLTDLYESSSTSRLAQTARLLAPKHLPMMIGLLGDDIGALAGGEAREWLDPYRGLAAREYGRHVRANIARLGELGALAMTARPEELDRKVLSRYRLLRAQHRV